MKYKKEFWYHDLQKKLEKTFIKAKAGKPKEKSKVL